MRFHQIAAGAAFANLASADYNTVLGDIYDIGNQTQQLTDLYADITTGVAGVVPVLNVQTASLALDNTIVKAIGDANASDEFGDDGSVAVATAILNLSPGINSSLSSLQAQRQNLDAYRPIVLASLYQLKEDTDTFGAAVLAKGNAAIKQAGPQVQSQIDGYFDSAISAFLAPTNGSSNAPPAPAGTTPVSDDVFDNIVKYANFSAAAYADTCPTPPDGSIVLNYFNNNATDAQATLFCIDATNELVLAFRGTSTATDWYTDLQAVKVPLNVTGASCDNCTVHQGFQTAYKSLRPDIAAAIASAHAAYPGSTLSVTGHSLGAAMASIASVTLVASGTPVEHVYTYGEPLNGNPTWAAYADSIIPPSRYFRVTHADDGVPKIPPPAAGYQHHGTELWESAATTAAPATTYDCGQNSTECNASEPLGQSPINAAHLFYGDGLIANVLHVASCGATPPLAS